MRNSEERLIASWAQVEYSDINAINDCGIDEVPDLTQDEIDGLMGIKKKAKRDRRTDINAVLSLLTGKEVEVKSPSAFGQTTKEFVMRPHRSTEQHRKIVEKMISRGYAFDPYSGIDPTANKTICEPDKFSPRELAPVAQAIFGILNSEDSYQRHNR
jgi:hypothetical protein